MRKVIIVGHHGAGKTTLSLLLDGHPELRTCIWQENFTQIFSSGLRTIIGRSRGRTPIRRDTTPYFRLRFERQEYYVWFPQFLSLLITHTYYSLVAAEAIAGRSSITAVADGLTPTPLRFDFARFDNAWKERLFSGEESFTVEEVVDHLYRALLEAYVDYPIQQKEFGAVFLQINDETQLKLQLSEGFDAKFLVVRRSPQTIWTTYCKRLRVTGATWAEAERDLRNYRGSFPTAKIDAFYDRIAANHPDKVMCLDMSDFVERTDPTMTRICKFLGIADHETVHRTTFQGCDFEGSSDHIGKVNDVEGVEVLSPRTLAFCRLQYEESGPFESFLKTDPMTALAYARRKLPSRTAAALSGMMTRLRK